MYFNLTTLTMTTALLLLLCLLLVSVAAAGSSGHVVSNVSGRIDSSISSSKLSQAFYILFNYEVNAPTWPAGYSEYDVFIASPQNMEANVTAHIKVRG